MQIFCYVQLIEEVTNFLHRILVATNALSFHFFFLSAFIVRKGKMARFFLFTSLILHTPTPNQQYEY